MHFDDELDTSGLHCPQVLLRAKKRLEQMKAGEILKIISTDPSSVLDFKVYAATQSHELMQTLQQEKKFIFWVKK
jgi:tRNA 2-thiouridine synthesizing protein A